MKKKLSIAIPVILLMIGGLVYFLFFMKDLSNRVVLPYIAHQPPRIDPHIPDAVPISDKMDEVIFDGLFNVSANPSGIVYQDGLGEFMGVDEEGTVSIRLKPKMKWHSSYSVSMEKENISIQNKKSIEFTAKDLRFTLKRIQKLGSLSPDYILIAQAFSNFDFSGPNKDNEIQFQFQADRIWSEGDIKEILSFKILPAFEKITAATFLTGTGPYLLAGPFENALYFPQNPQSKAHVQQLILKPFIDNSTFTTAMRTKNINALLSTPFGAMSPILGDTSKFFYKSTIADVFFALFFNVEKLSIAQRTGLRNLIHNKKILDRFFNLGTQQQRSIANYRGKGNNYNHYLNHSIFPTTSYYVEEEIVTPNLEKGSPELDLLPDTVLIKTCVNFGLREELSALVEIFNDPSLFGGKIKASAVSNGEIKKGNYHAVLVPVTGYRSNFLFDLYSIFMREPNFALSKINLKTSVNRKGERTVDPASFKKDNNFFRLDATSDHPEAEDISQLLEYVYGFMSTHEIGDKQAYAQFIDELDQKMALGSWLFSLPALAYFRTQFKESSIDLYGTASQLSTIEHWEER